ncbi:site-specific integrase [Devosia sp. CN2-171]|uniref:site-specific integrase n=1 Tax=Devosia sp. CN2-171 TaxID=3400909 RepID=UPI003BF85B28
MRQIRSEDFAKYRDERLMTIKPSTLRRQLNVLRHALRTAGKEWGWSVPQLALAQVQIPPVAHFYVGRITDDVVAKLLAAAECQSNPCIAFSIRLALQTGMRRGELLGLDWGDVDLDKKQLLIRTSKNGRPRMIPLSPLAVVLFKGKISANAKGSVLPITVNGLRLGFERARALARVELRFHDLRHEAISRLFDIGLTIPEVQLISGHRTLSQLSRYSHPDIKRLVGKLAVQCEE